MVEVVGIWNVVSDPQICGLNTCRATELLARTFFRDETIVFNIPGPFPTDLVLRERDH